MLQEIRLVRHGRSALQRPRRWITAKQFREWIGAYHETGIAADSTPPGELIAATRDIDVVVCSDLPRSRESAARLAPEKRLRVSPRFREAGRPLDGIRALPLPMSTWDFVSRVLWRVNWIAGDESIHAARARAHEATLELIRLADEFSRVVCVAHGTFNSLVGAELRRLGWEGPRRVLDVHWGMTVYRRAPSPG